MHEMSIAISLLEIAEAEAQKQGCSRIIRLRVDYGVLSGILPEALTMCFAALIQNTPHKDATLELNCLPLRLRCPVCSATFGGEDQSAIWQPCPACGERLGHIVEQGKELLLAQLEAIKD